MISEQVSVAQPGLELTTLHSQGNQFATNPTVLQ